MKDDFDWSLPMLVASRPVLAIPENELSGYRNLQETEGRQMELSLRAMPSVAGSMYRYITLFDGMLRGERECPEHSETSLISCQLRLRLAITSVASMKTSFDLALGGYYSQAFAILRHMLESWQTMAYLRVLPEAWHHWYPSPQGHPPRLPDLQRIANRLRKPGNEFEAIRINALQVEKLIRDCNDGAHPSMWAMGLPETDVEATMQVGGIFKRRFLAGWYSTATVACALLISELEFTLPSDDRHKKEFKELARMSMDWRDETFEPERSQ